MHNISLLESITQCLPDLVWAKDMDGKYVFADDAYIRWQNAKCLEDIVGKTDIALAAARRAEKPDDDEWWTWGPVCRDSDDIVIECDEACTFIETGMAEGKDQILITRKAPWRDKDGVLLGTVGSGHDITVRDTESRRLHAELSNLIKSDCGCSRIKHDELLKNLEGWAALFSRHRYTVEGGYNG